MLPRLIAKMQTKTWYKDDGPDGKAQVITEYEGKTPVFSFRGFYDGKDHFTLYPHHAIVKGTRRDKTVINIRQVERG